MKGFFGIYTARVSDLPQNYVNAVNDLKSIEELEVVPATPIGRDHPL